MQVILIKYLQVFCFALFLSNNISCDTTLVGKKQSDNELYKLSICTARCMEKSSSLTLEQCYKKCNEPLSEKIKEIRQIYENLEVKFICRDAKSFVLEIVKSPYDIITNMKTKDDFRNPKIYIFKISEANHSVPVSKFVYLTDSRIIEIQNLSSNTLYNISASIVHTNGEYSVIAKEVQLSTLEKNYKPEKIYDVDVSRYKVEENNKNYLSAVITWKPAKDMTCYYEILCYSSVVEADFEIVQKEVKAPKTLFSYKVENLTFGTEYHIGVRGKNPRDTVNESDMIWHNVTTPTCLQWYKNNLTICPPNVPEEFNVTVTFQNMNVFSMNLTWKKLFPEPDYYIIKILDLNRFVTSEPNSITINVSKGFTSYYLPTVILYGFQCEVHLIAVSPGGNSTATITNILERHIDITGLRTMKLVAAIMTPIMFIVISSLVILIICHRRAKLRRYQERCKYFEDLEKKAPVDPNSNFEFNSKNFSVLPAVDSLTSKQDLEKFFINDEMEICRSDVQLFEILGEGAFGLVRRGTVRLNDDTKTEVAVKMLKDHPINDDIVAFRREIDVMKSVGKHPNIVSIIGHCTKNINEMLLLTEYCSLGNLLNFLRAEWKYLNNINLQKHCRTPESQKQDENIFNFDTSIMDKTSFKYKNINDNKTEQEDITCSIDLGHLADLKTNIVINKAYGYNGSCTNSCKCKVDIISKVCLKDADKGPLEPKNEVKIQNCDCKIRNADSEITSPLLVETKTYYKFLKTKDKKNLSIEQSERQPLKSSDLLHIAKHIAMGMEFLSKNKVVHRDLAARNVLVCKDRTVKIADFGLSRDVYQENIYKKTGNGKLPIKWLALESMTHQVYTSHSDVWSFGILLYEIVTLGGTPYPLIPTSRLLKLLKAGYRMERPKNCGQTLYNLMLSCWHVNPHDRPTFTEICKIIDDILMSSPDEYIINFCFSESDKGSKSISDESYLKPI